jgi:hypothetical protein
MLSNSTFFTLCSSELALSEAEGSSVLKPFFSTTN